MSIKRWNAKRDANEPDIVRALEQVGAKVLRLDSFDLLVLFRGTLFMLDAKMPTGRTTLAQDDLLADGWPLHMVVDEISALRAVGAVSEPGQLRMAKATIRTKQGAA
jgi:hypothetical protein